MLTPAYFSYLSDELRAERAKVTGKRRDDRVDEMMALEVVLQDEAKKLDEHHAKLGAATERFKALLGAKDKKAALLELVSLNHVDRALLEIMQLNIDQARGAGREDVAKFIEKLKAAAGEYATQN